MDFGRVPDVTRVRFELPPVTPRTLGVLRESRGDSQTPGIFFGAPVWARKEWVGKLYPAGAKNPDYLRYYSRQLSAIELNTSFYRIPDTATIDSWRMITPAGFRFCPKFFQGITHDHELTGAEAESLTLEFCEAFLKLGDRLGISFLQLPPTFHPGQLGELESFLDRLPPGFPVAVEFRSPAWFDSGALIDEALDALEQRSIATVITDVAGRRDVSHSSLTAPRVLIRFIGNSLHPSDYTRIDSWVERLAGWLDEGLQELYFFVHQPDDLVAPDLISYWVNRMNERCGLKLMDWQRPAAPQLDLF